MRTLPTEMIRVLASFAPLFSERVWQHAQVLLMGAILAPGRRTVGSALRAMGLDQEKRFHRYHRVLSRASCSSREASRLLLRSLAETFVPDGPLVVGIDETLERRRGAKISAKGIYRDPVRSSHNHFVKASGLRWVCVTLLAPIPWASRAWALAFLSALAYYSERYAEGQGKRHKKLTDWAWQLLLLVRRWHPEREIVAVADSTYASLKLEQSHRLHQTPAAGRCPLRTGGPAKTPRSDRKTPPQRPAAAEPLGGRGSFLHRLGADRARQLVRQGGACRRGGLGHGALVPHRVAAGALALGPDPRSAREVRAASPPMHRPRRRSSANLGLVR